MVHICNSNVFVSNTELHIVGRDQSSVSHIVLLDSHECGRVVRLSIAVPFIPADLQFLGVLFQLARIFPKPFVMPLLRALVVPAPVDEVCFIELPEGSILLQHLGQIFWDVFRVCRDGNAAGSQFHI